MPTHYQGTAEQVRALDAFIKLTRAADSLGARLYGRSTLGDLTPTQFGVLESLYHLGPMRQGEVCAKLLKSGGNISLVVDNLKKRGLVQREQDPDDRRAVVVSLTDRGRERIGGIVPDHVADIVDEFAILTPEEQDTLGRLCRILGKQERVAFPASQREEE
jgi:MarR family 2-MHQ and catechol resistance regulon transcriptional repressor